MCVDVCVCHLPTKGDLQVRTLLGVDAQRASLTSGLQEGGSTHHHTGLSCWESITLALSVVKGSKTLASH